MEKTYFVFWPWDQDDEYGGIFSSEEDEWHFPCEKGLSLPIGSEVYLSDNEIEVTLFFIIKKYHYDVKTKITRIQLVFKKNKKITPGDFHWFIKKNWIKGNKI